MNQARLFCVLLLLLLSINLVQVPSAQAEPNLRIATRLVKPDAFEENGQLVGFSVDLWRSIAAQLQLKPKVKIYANAVELLTAIESGQADIGMAAMPITIEREIDFDFSYPVLTSGLQIMIPERSTRRRLLPRLVAALLNRDLLELVGLALFLMLIPVHIIWFTERRHPAGLIETRSYFPGIFKVYWWAMSTLATQADEMPKATVGRITALFWMFAGVLFVAYFTAVFTTAFTVRELQGNISQPSDLRGKHVVTVEGSTAETYLRQHEISPTVFSQLEQAYETLLKGEADAVVLDAIVLQYFASHEGKGKVQMVGNIFQEEIYGIVLPQNSPLREPINRAILTLLEKGTYRQIHDKWFGDSE